jgi:hypothetical protein
VSISLENSYRECHAHVPGNGYEELRKLLSLGKPIYRTRAMGGLVGPIASHNRFGVASLKAKEKVSARCLMEVETRTKIHVTASISLLEIGALYSFSSLIYLSGNYSMHGTLSILWFFA